MSNKSQPRITWDGIINFIKQLFSFDDSVNGASLLPIRLTMVYLSFSLVVYVWGPFAWTTANPTLFYTLIAMYMVALWLGYRIGAKKKFFSVH